MVAAFGIALRFWQPSLASYFRARREMGVGTVSTLSTSEADAGRDPCGPTVAWGAGAVKRADYSLHTLGRGWRIGADVLAATGYGEKMYAPAWRLIQRIGHVREALASKPGLPPIFRHAGT